MDGIAGAVETAFHQAGSPRRCLNLLRACAFRHSSRKPTHDWAERNQGIPVAVVQVGIGILQTGADLYGTASGDGFGDSEFVLKATAGDPTQKPDSISDHLAAP